MLGSDRFDPSRKASYVLTCSRRGFFGDYAGLPPLAEHSLASSAKFPKGVRDARCRYNPVIIASGIGRAGFRARWHLLRQKQLVQPAIDGPGRAGLHLAGAAALAIPSDISWRLAAAELRAAELR